MESEEVADGEKAADQKLSAFFPDERSGERNGQDGGQNAAEHDKRGFVRSGAPAADGVGGRSDGTRGKDPDDVDPRQKAGEGEDQRLQQEDIRESAVCPDTYGKIDDRAYGGCGCGDGAADAA